MKKYTNIFPEYYKNGNEFICQNNIIKSEIRKFHFGDDIESYKKKIKSLPLDWHYRTKDITYNLNSSGYRCDEFSNIDWKNSIVMLGCSNVFGLGVAEDETLPYQLSLLTGKKVINLGVVGASNQLLLDMSIILKNNYELPKSLIVIWTSSSRFTFYGFEHLYHVGPWFIEDNGSWFKGLNKKYSEIFKLLYSEKSHEIITYKHIKETFKHIWSDKIKYYEGTFFDEISYYGEIEMKFNNSKTARDFCHPGFDDYKIAAKIIYEKLI